MTTARPIPVHVACEGVKSRRVVRPALLRAVRWLPLLLAVACGLLIEPRPLLMAALLVLSLPALVRAYRQLEWF